MLQNDRKVIYPKSFKLNFHGSEEILRYLTVLVWRYHVGKNHWNQKSIKPESYESNLETRHTQPKEGAYEQQSRK